MKKSSDLLLRFSRAQRLVHWVFTVTFFALAITGLFLIVPGWSGLAVGGTSRLIHRIMAVPFMAAPLFYLLFDFKGLKRLVSDSFSYDKDDLRWLMHFPRYVLGFAHGLPPQGRINAGEKLHHAVIILTFFSISISGVLLWFGKGLVGAAMFSWMLIVHDVSMIIMSLLTIGHMYFVFVYGALGGMLTGHVSRAYAKMEHVKWLAELEAAERRKSA